VPVAGFQRVFHHALRLLRRDLEYAITELGNDDPVIQRQVRNNDHANSICFAEKISVSLVRILSSEIIAGGSVDT